MADLTADAVAARATEMALVTAWPASAWRDAATTVIVLEIPNPPLEVLGMGPAWTRSWLGLMYGNTFSWRPAFADD